MPGPETSKEGGMHFFSFSGSIVCESDLRGDWTFNYEDHSISFLCPVRVAAANWRPIPQFSRSRFIDLYPGAYGVHDLFRLSASPHIDDDGNPSIMLNFGDEHQDDLPKDTFPVLIQGPNWSSHTQFAERVLFRALEMVRVETGQWWVGRSAESFTGNQHVLFEMQNGSLFASPIPTCKQISPFSGTTRMSSRLWGESLSAAFQNKQLDPAESLLSDSIYFYVLGDVRLALVTLATCFESARDMACDRMGVNFRGTDLIRHLSRDFARVSGRDLSVDDEEAFQFVRSVWIARGNLAHGKGLLWDGDRQFGEYAAEDFFKPARRVVSWLKSIGSNDVVRSTA